MKAKVEYSSCQNSESLMVPLRQKSYKKNMELPVQAADVCPGLDSAVYDWKEKGQTSKESRPHFFPHNITDAHFP
jgi:hypothetical protein